MAGEIMLLLLTLFAAGLSAAAESGCEEAQRLVRRGIELADTSAEEEQAYRQALTLCPKLPEAHYNLGLIEYKRGRHREAAGLFEQAIDIERKPAFLLALASARVGAADLEGARQLYEEVLQDNPRSLEGHQGLAVVFEKMQRYDRAIEQLQKALAIDNKNSLSHYNLAVIYEGQGKLNEALDEYRSAVEADQNSFAANFFLGLLYRKMGRLDAAAGALNKAAVLEPDNAEVYKALGVVHEKLGDFDKAELAFRRAVELDEKDVNSLINLAVTLIRKRKESVAEELLLKEKERFPQEARLLSVLGWAQLGLGKYQAAEQSLKSSLELDAMNSAAHHHLGLLYERTGRSEDAEREFRAARQLDPQLPAPLR